MAGHKINRGGEASRFKDICYIKWVRKANMYCETIIKDGKQINNWYSKENKPSGN